MKEIAIIPLVLLLLSPIVFATETFQIGGTIGLQECDYYVDDTVQLPQVTATHQLDTDPSGDGITTYIYCTWGIDGTGNGPTQMSSQLCPDPQETYTFNDEGTYSYGAVVAYGVFENGVLIDSGTETPLTQDYNVCYRGPSPSALQQLINLLINLICSIFPWFGFCP